MSHCIGKPKYVTFVSHVSQCGGSCTAWPGQAAEKLSDATSAPELTHLPPCDPAVPRGPAGPAHGATGARGRRRELKRRAAARQLYPHNSSPRRRQFLGG